MIRKSWDKDKWLLTAQAEHARVAGLIAALWNFNGEKPSGEALYAIAHHDDGWKPYDEAPTANAAGAPRNFDELDPKEYLPLWTQSVAFLTAEKKHYAAGLVAGHFAALARSADLARLGPRLVIAIGNFIGEQKSVINRATNPVMSLSERSITVGDTEALKAGASRPLATAAFYERDLRFLQVCDLLSLLLCMDFAGDTEITSVPFLRAPGTIKVSRHTEKLSLTLDPLPFKKNLRDNLACVIIPRRIYETNEELQSVIKSTKPVTTEVHLGSAQR